MQRFFLSSLICLMAGFGCLAQQFADADLALLQQGNFKPASSELPRRNFLISGNTFVARYNPVKLFFSSSMYFYQNVVSVQLNSNCPFHHNCSAFSKLCIAEHGLVKGFFLTGDRLTRCSTFGLKDIKNNSDIENGKIIDEPGFYQ